MRWNRNLVSYGAGVLAVVAMAAGLLCASGASSGKIKVLFVRRGGHDWKGLSPLLVDVMHKTGDFEVTLSEDLNDFTAERIKAYDVAMYTGSGTNFTDANQEKGLCDFVRGGGGYVGIHSATDAFKKSDAYWELVGGRFAGHGGGKFKVYIHDHDHPVTKGLEDFEIQDETYRHRYHLNLVMRSLIRMDRGKERQSMGWVQPYGKGRVFYTSLGHGREAWANPHFQRLVVRGAYWAAGRKPKSP
jgi:type 1 glutamine amidotransferase